MTDVQPDPEQLPHRIETDRLLLRPWRHGDAEALHEAWCESLAHLKPWIPWSRVESPTIYDARGLVAKWIEEFRAGATRLYAILDRTDSSLIGGVGLFCRVGPDALEIGYWVRLARAGSGFATEASDALTHVGFSVPGVVRMQIHTSPENVSSARVPEKLGYALAGVREVQLAEGAEPKTSAVYTLDSDRRVSPGSAAPKTRRRNGGA